MVLIPIKDDTQRAVYRLLRNCCSPLSNDVIVTAGLESPKCNDINTIDPEEAIGLAN
jgi:hypothetical protein